MQRYLLNISYIGTQFKGAQRLVKLTEDVREDVTTIQGRIEMGLRNLRPKNHVAAVTSSRTDSGVHALHSTMHVDLHRPNDEPYDTNAITQTLNRYFYLHNVQIRILSTKLVPANFHCRFAESRTYLYRLAVIKSQTLHERNSLHHIPIEEIDRAYYLCTNTFDVEKFKSASKLFLGRHDFRTFMGKGSHQPDKITRRTMRRLEIEEGAPKCYGDFTQRGALEEECQYFNIFIESSGFLYKQVSCD